MIFSIYKQELSCVCHITKISKNNRIFYKIKNKKLIFNIRVHLITLKVYYIYEVYIYIYFVRVPRINTYMMWLNSIIKLRRDIMWLKSKRLI